MAAAERPPVVDETLLADALALARDDGFVGRATQLEAFDRSLDGDGAPVVLVHGPGGIGKTALLEAFSRRAARAGRRTVYLDARDVPCSAAAVAEAVRERAVRAGCADGSQPEVLLVDGWELLEPLERWFRESFLPSRPARSVTVLAGRAAPRTDWWLDVGWRQLVRIEELAALDPSESERLLTARGVDESRRPAVARLGRGHPLALVLLAEAGSVPAQLADQPDVVDRLCRLVLDDVPDAAHRAGLATCAHATRMTHDLLAHTIGKRADEVWAWLEARPYVRRGATGLFLHDVVREVFEAEFARRSPDAYASLHRRIKDYFLARLFDPQEPYHERAAIELLMLHRRPPLPDAIAAGTEAIRGGSPPVIVRATAEDTEKVVRLIHDGEGAGAADLARRWIADPHTHVQLARSDEGVLAFAVQVYVPASGGVADRDPVARAIRRVVEEHGALRPGERINVNRFAGASGDYRTHPLVLLVNGVSCILEWALEPAAWSFIVTIAADAYGPYFEYLGMSRLLTIEYAGHELVGYGWDRRRFPPSALFELMARRELNGETGPPPASMVRPASLSRPDFAGAVHAALRDLTRPEQLTGSPLLTSALVQPASPAPVEALVGIVRAVVAELSGGTRGADHRAVLERTYLRGAPSQEAAAELLGLPFSTYRRHLARAEERLVEALWAIETGIRRPPEIGQEVSSE